MIVGYLTLVHFVIATAINVTDAKQANLRRFGGMVASVDLSILPMATSDGGIAAASAASKRTQQDSTTTKDVVATDGDEEENALDGADVGSDIDNYEFVGEGFCQDINSNFYDYEYYNSETCEECASKCIQYYNKYDHLTGQVGFQCDKSTSLYNCLCLDDYYGVGPVARSSVGQYWHDFVCYKRKAWRAYGESCVEDVDCISNKCIERTCAVKYWYVGQGICLDTNSEKYENIGFLGKFGWEGCASECNKHDLAGQVGFAFDQLNDWCGCLYEKGKLPLGGDTRVSGRSGDGPVAQTDKNIVYACYKRKDWRAYGESCVEDVDCIVNVDKCTEGTCPPPRRCYELKVDVRDTGKDQKDGAVLFSQTQFDNDCFDTNVNLSGISFIEIPPATDLVSFSVSLWFYLTDYQNKWARIFDFGSSEGSDGGFLMTPVHGHCNNKMGVTIHGNGPTVLSYTCYKGDLKPKQWYHVAFTYDKGGEGSKLYLNGAFVSSGSYKDGEQSFDDWPSNNPRWYLGKSNWLSDPPFIGRFKDLEIFNVNISPSDVKSIYDRSHVAFTADDE